MSLERIKLSVWNGQIRERKEIYCNTLRFVSKLDRWEKIFSPNFTVYLFSDFSLIVPLQLCTLFAALVPPPGRSSLPPPPPAIPGIESCTLQKIRYDKIDFLFLFLRSTVGIEIAPSGFETNTFATTPMVHNNKLLTKLESIHIALSCFVQFINCFS